MVQKTTMVEVAKQAGVHQSTVSRALKNDYRLSSATRDHIQAIARKLGYKPNPLVSALIAERHKNRASGYGSVIAFLTAHPTRYSWRNRSSRSRRSYQALETHFAERGYSFEEFCLGEPGMTPQRMRKILLYRGIRGIVVCPIPAEMNSTLDFDFSQFAAVAMDTTLKHPKLDRVSMDYTQITKQTLLRLISSGFQRVGYATTIEMDDHIDSLPLGVFLAEQKKHPDLLLDPLFFHYEQDRTKILEYVKQHKPEVLVIASRYELQQIRGWLESASYQVPRDISLVCLDCYPDSESDESGMTQDIDSQGAAVAEFLAGRVEHGIFGVPIQPRSILVGGLWKAGKTLIDPEINSSKTNPAGGQRLSAKPPARRRKSMTTNNRLPKPKT